jgi:hypothetical protein
LGFVELDVFDQKYQQRSYWLKADWVKNLFL